MLQIKLFTSSWVLTIGTASVAVYDPGPPLGGPLLLSPPNKSVNQLLSSFDEGGPWPGCNCLRGSGTSDTSSKALLLEALAGANQRALYMMFFSSGAYLGDWKQ
tara:strand:- start:796 stop:1107 length:312 start_codon:yes stop_codon:yes gene_type:complete